MNKNKLIKHFHEAKNRIENECSNLSWEDQFPLIKDTMVWRSISAALGIKTNFSSLVCSIFSKAYKIIVDVEIDWNRIKLDIPYNKLLQIYDAAIKISTLTTFQ